MKKLKWLLCSCSLLITMSGYAQTRDYANPSAVYCEMMGYTYEIRQDQQGNSMGVCILPNNQAVSAWDFFKGKVAQEYSYCAKKGYLTETETTDTDGYVTECAVCTQETEKGVTIRIPMTELMEKNGEPLRVESGKKTSDPILEQAKYDNNFRYAKDAPASFDWRSYNGHTYIGGVRDQGSCGSCYAFGANAANEGTYNVANNLYDASCVDLSESFIIWCLGSISPYNSHFSGCDGADYDYMELQASCDSGVCYESDFPYVITDPGTCTHWNDPRVKMNNWYRVDCSDTTAIQTAIMTYGVVDAAVYVTTDFQNYTTGIFSDANTTCYSNPCYYTPTNHAISLVGWGHDPTDGLYWILRNSWGASWGESGYMRIRWDAARVACEVCYMEYDLPDENDPTNFFASAVSTSEIDLSWNLNGGRDVLLAWSPDGIFGTPAEGVNYSVSDPIPGGGEVLYAGSNESLNHMPLDDNTTYYYKIWTKIDMVPTWSAGIAASATTDALEVPFNLAASVINDNDVELIWNQAGEEFSDGFESGDFSAWSELIQGPGTIGDSPYPYWNVQSGYIYEGIYGAVTNWGYNLNTWLIAPEITATSSTVVSFFWQSSYYWHVDPFNGGDLFVKISLDGGSTWEPYLWTFGEMGVWTNWAWYQTTIDLSAWAGQDIMVAFNVVANDNADIAIDNVYIGDNIMALPIGTVAKTSPADIPEDSKSGKDVDASREHKQLTHKAFSAYAVYRNDSKIAETASTTYTDEDLANGDYTYYITSLYTSPEQESDPSNSASVSITVGVELIEITTPNGGENWPALSSQDITWTSIGNSGNVHIEYSTDNGSSWSDVIASTEDDGSYSWTIPDEPSTTCLVRVTDTDGSPGDESDAVFTISPVPEITVTSPDGGEDWAAGTTHDITWSSVNTSGTVRIEYSTNNGGSWNDIVASTADDGSYAWTVPNEPSTTCLIRISDSDGSPSDESEAVFTVSVITDPGPFFMKFPDGLAPDIDGTIDAIWADLPVHHNTKQFIGEDIYSLYRATWQAGWNDTALFILVVVEDDDFYPPWESGDADWMSDKPEIYLDVNDELADGAGPSLLNSGHYQISPTFKEGFDQFDTSGYITLYSTFSNLTYGYEVTDPDYIYEYAVNFSSLTSNVGDTLDPYTDFSIGFDVYIIDRDDDGLSRKRAVWMNDGAIDQAWYNMDDCARVAFCGINTRSPQISVSDSCFSFGDVVLGNSITETLHIYNLSCDDPLIVSDIASTLGEYTVDKTTMTIPPGDQDMVTITFTPSGVASFDGSLTVYSNDIDTVLCLYGNGVEPPMVSFSPDTVKATITSSNDSVTMPLTIYNTGGSDLTFSLSSRYTDPRGVSKSSIAIPSSRINKIPRPVYSVEEQIQRTIDKYNYEKKHYKRSEENENSILSADKAANIIYVDVNSASSLEDGSQENPYKSITAGVDNALSGDKIIVIPGIYYEEEISIDKSLTLNGNGAIVFGTGEDNSKSIFEVHSGASDAIIKNFVITNCDWGIFVYSSSGSVNIINNTIYNIGGTCVVAFADETLMNNIIGNSIIGIHYDYGTLNNSYNNVYGNSADWYDCSPGTGSISQDPLFVDEAAYDFTLQAGSPCIDAGNPGILYNDADDSRNDMGAFGGWEMGVYNPLSWLSYEPDNGTVDIYDPITVDVKFKSADLDPGVYASEIIINSNDPVTPQLAVPCKLTLSYSSTHFVTVWDGTPGYDHQNFYTLGARIDGVDMETGDEIGIFDGPYCVGAGTLTGPVSMGSILVILASADDPTTTEIDGFTDGNEIIYRLWDASEGVEIDYVVSSYTGGDEVFTGSGSSSVELDGYTTLDQDIDLVTGWNIFSLYVEPPSIAMADIVQPLVDADCLVKVQDESGNSIEKVPGTSIWMDYIGDWENTEGYKIRTNCTTVLSVTGTPISLPLTIDLLGGWNIMSYPVTDPQNAMDALDELIVADNLVKVQDESGNSIEKVPGTSIWMDYIGDFAPDEGYKIRVTEADDITFSSPAKIFGEQDIKTGVTDAEHFTTCWTGHGLDHMNFYLDLSEIRLEPGDEIAVYDGEYCVGAGAIIDPDRKYISLVASLDDPVTSEIDGFTEGNPVELVIWRMWDNREIALSDAKYLFNTRNHFEAMGSSFVKAGSSIVSLDYNSQVNTGLGDNYPNPFSQSTVIPFRLANEADIEIGVYDLLGQRVNTLVKDHYEPGRYNVSWNGTDYADIQVKTGIYLVKMVADNQVFINMIEINK